MSTSSPLGLRLTPLSKQVIGLLVALYLAQVGARMAGDIDTLALLGWRHGSLAPWQPLTSWIAADGAQLPPLFDWLGVAFGLPVLESTLSRRGQLGFLSLVFGLAIGLGLLLDLTGLLPVRQHAGLSHAILPLFVLFGAAHRDARLNLFFAVPILGWHFALGATAIGLLVQVLGRFPAGGVGLGALIAPWAWVAWTDPRNPIRRRLLKRRYDDLSRKLQVLEGGRAEAGRPRKPVRWGGGSQVH